MAFDFAYSKSGLGGYGDDGSYALSPALTLYDLRLLVNYRLASFDRSSLSAALGPMLQVWSGEAILDTQTRLGGAASAHAGRADQRSLRPARDREPRRGRVPV